MTVSDITALAGHDYMFFGGAETAGAATTSPNQQDKDKLPERSCGAT